MSQLFNRRANTIARAVLPGGLLIIVLALLVWSQVGEPDYVTDADYAPEQPVPFSHQRHAGRLGVDCKYCHNQVERSPFAGIPTTHTCMSCHSQVWTDAEMLEPVRESYRNDTPLKWTKVYDLPDFVEFKHSIHVNSGVGCESCHGRVDQQPLTRQVRPLTMEWCLDCHRNPEKNLRPRSEVYTMGWQPEGSQEELGERLVEEYNIRTDRLTNCSICHY